MTRLKYKENVYVEPFNRTVRYKWLSKKCDRNLADFLHFETNLVCGLKELPNMVLVSITPKQRLTKNA